MSLGRSLVNARCKGSGGGQYRDMRHDGAVDKTDFALRIGHLFILFYSNRICSQEEVKVEGCGDCLQECPSKTLVVKALVGVERNHQSSMQIDIDVIPICS